MWPVRHDSTITRDRSPLRNTSQVITRRLAGNRRDSQADTDPAGDAAKAKCLATSNINTSGPINPSRRKAAGNYPQVTPCDPWSTVLALVEGQHKPIGAVSAPTRTGDASSAAESSPQATGPPRLSMVGPVIVGPDPAGSAAPHASSTDSQILRPLPLGRTRREEGRMRRGADLRRPRARSPPAKLIHREPWQGTSLKSRPDRGFLQAYPLNVGRSDIDGSRSAIRGFAVRRVRTVSSFV
jgi:hypothetical protein